MRKTTRIFANLVLIVGFVSGIIFLAGPLALEWFQGLSDLRQIMMIVVAALILATLALMVAVHAMLVGLLLLCGLLEKEDPEVDPLAAWICLVMAPLYILAELSRKRDDRGGAWSRAIVEERAEDLRARGLSSVADAALRGIRKPAHREKRSDKNGSIENSYE